MASILPSDLSENGTQGVEGHAKISKNGPGWYFTKKQIEENSPSKQDGIDWKKESWLRRNFCAFLQRLGKKLKVSEKTIATASTLCHRFYLRQSFGRNDWRVIATTCMLLAGKVDDCLRHRLTQVIFKSYEIMNNEKDSLAAERIQQKDVYKQQKELILLGESLVLQTLSFDLELDNPYKSLFEAISKLKMARTPLHQVAWNYVKDGLRTCLCLQFQPHHIAVGAIFLAAKSLKVKIPSDGKSFWWQRFGVTSVQLEEISHQIMDLYEQEQMSPLESVNGATESGATSWASTKVLARNVENAARDNNSHTRMMTLRLETFKPGASKTGLQSLANHVEQHVSSNHTKSSDYVGTEIKHRLEDEAKGHPQLEGNLKEVQEMLRSQSGYLKDEKSNGRRKEMMEAVENDKQANKNLDLRDGMFGRPPLQVVNDIDRDNIKAALEKRRDKIKSALEKQRKTSGHIIKKQNVMDDDNLIERMVEDGVEKAARSEKNNQDEKLCSKPSYRSDNEHHHGSKSLSSSQSYPSSPKEGEIIESPKLCTRKRKASASLILHFR